MKKGVAGRRLLEETIITLIHVYKHTLSLIDWTLLSLHSKLLILCHSIN